MQAGHRDGGGFRVHARLPVEAGDGVQAVARATELAPDVVLMDIRMPRLDGIEATRRLTRSTAVQVLVLTTYDLDEYVFEALRAGASGFLLKDSGRPFNLSGPRSAGPA